jgi:putative toxin-antitoxin system antitoxin component (TIGR02293 family)
MAWRFSITARPVNELRRDSFLIQTQLQTFTTTVGEICIIVGSLITCSMKKQKERGGIPKPVAKSTGKKAGLRSKSSSKNQPMKLQYQQAKADAAELQDLVFSYKSVDDNNALAIIKAVRSGISFNYFTKLVRSTPFSLAEWAKYLQVSERTIQRNQKESKNFPPVQSEKIVDLAMLYKYGVEVFGNKNNFDTWLSSKSVVLGGRIPKELLDTKFGIDMVKNEVGRIEHGVLA